MKILFYLKYATHYGETLWMKIHTTEGKESERDILLPMQYLNNDYWKFEAEPDTLPLRGKNLQYRYVLKDLEGAWVSEFPRDRNIVFDEIHHALIKVYDIWNFAGACANVFYTAPFQDILLPKYKRDKQRPVIDPTHTFKVKAPLLSKNEVICLLGDSALLNNWDTKNPLLLQKESEWWHLSLNLTGCSFPLAYKYGVYNKKTKVFVHYENGGNRVCFEPAAVNELTILQDGFINLAENTWKGAGVAIPVFSLRTKDDFGVGEFSDLKLLADWAAKTGLKLIQILPVNDTTANFTWQDSYPYAAISAFALHPLYINLATVAGKEHPHIPDGLKRKQKQLNDLPEVDYEAVTQFKLAVLQELFDADGERCLRSEEYKKFFEENKNWLKPYAAFCYLRDKYKSPDPAKWKSNNTYVKADVDRYFHISSAALKQVHFYCYIQYHLHVQLTEAVQYAHQKGIVMKGDIPIGVYRYGCDAWMSPELYKMELQAGAPPDDFAVKGQNWGFPTYNWAQMQADGFAWWKGRFEQMSDYFDAFRIDHILGFFRIWSIPVHAVQGIMGRFDPCLPVSVNEFGEKGIWFDHERFCEPYITDEVLHQIFGDRTTEVKEKFLKKHGPTQYRLLPEFDTQRKVQEYFKNCDESRLVFQNGLYELISNVILFEEEGSALTKFHFRIAIDQTTSFKMLQPYTREKLWSLYLDYFYYRQDEFWRKESLKKLPGLKAATNMLVCGEDLGMVPASVPEVMKQLGILSLEIQRMPKQTDREFFNPADASYLSVVTPSTHDMSTIRGWWQESREITQRFYNRELGQSGEAPYFCEPWICRAILLQHLYAPAMWSIFQLQDILGMSAELRREKPEQERINIPSNPHHYWRYRMHISLEQLIKEKAFNAEVKNFIEHSGRG